MTQDREQDKEMEGYARECVRLAGLSDNPDLREELLQLAREWMAASMGERDAPGRKPLPEATP